ncbi:Vps16, N-terminal region-domain-containing protein [Cladochytrium replicatum]|nr:Vps16, N-terminal region-domain-containing protein [Cladochytrium replicatum]
MPMKRRRMAMGECGYLYHAFLGIFSMIGFTVSIAPFGGPIAIIRNDKKVLSLQSQNVKPVMYIYTSSGRLINQFQWDKGRIVGMGWTNTELLVCVLEYGSVRVYDIHGEFLPDAKDYGVYDCHIWESGVVALTGNCKLVVVNDLDEPRPRLLSDPGLNQAPSCWTFIPPHLTLSRHIEVYLSVGSTVLVVDASNVGDQQVQHGPFSRMAVSPNGKVLALFTADGRLWVVSSDFQKELAEFSTGSATPPLQMTWFVTSEKCICAEDSVVMHWEDTLLMVGPFGDWIKYSYDGVVSMVPEVDGVRIISSDKCEFLQKVPDACEKVFKIGSTDPGAILYDAFELFEKRSAKADENIRNIKPELADAVDTCIEAAGSEFNEARQKMLLKAGSFGKCFLDSYDVDHFVEVCQVIRVMNALREPDIGIPLTLQQYRRLTPDILVNRLVNRHHHLLALRLCEYLQIKKDRVMIHWACAKIKKAVEDEETLSRLIVEKLGTDRGVSYAEVAKTAFQSGQSKLATKLLEFEPRAGSQVPLLMSMKEDENALTKAIESGDTDLVYLVMLHMKRNLPTADFFRIVSNKPVACSLFETFCKQQDIKSLKDFYYQDDRKLDIANVTLLESCGMEQEEANIKLELLKSAMKMYQEDRNGAFEAKAIDDQVRLMGTQIQLERDVGHSFMNLSLSETIFKCLLLGHGNRAAKLKSDYKVPDKRFWWLKIKALIKTQNWDGLKKFARSNQRFGFSGIIDSLIKANHITQAQHFLEILIKTGGPEKDAYAERYIALLRPS